MDPTKSLTLAEIERRQRILEYVPGLLAAVLHLAGETLNWAYWITLPWRASIQARYEGWRKWGGL